MISIARLEPTLGKESEIKAFKRAFTTGLAIFALTILFGIFVWDKAMLRHTHAQWHPAIGHVIKTGKITFGSADTFEVYRLDTVGYSTWNGTPRTTTAMLQALKPLKAPVDVCVSRSGGANVPDEYNASNNPCKPSQSPIGFSVVIGLVLCLIGTGFFYWLIGNAMHAHIGMRTARTIRRGWCARKARSGWIKSRTRWRTSTCYRLVHGRRIPHALAQAETLLAELEIMKPDQSGEVEALRASARQMVTSLRQRPHAERVNTIRSELNHLSNRVADEQAVEANLQREGAKEAGLHDLD